MHDLVPVSSTAPLPVPAAAAAAPQLPEPLIADRVSDLGALYVNGRLLGSLRAFATKLAKAGVNDDATAGPLRERYNELRSRVLDLVDRSVVADTDELVPACPENAAVAHVAFIADQAATWLESLYEVDHFLISQRLQTVAARAAQAQACDQLKLLDAKAAAEGRRAKDAPRAEADDRPGYL